MTQKIGMNVEATFDAKRVDQGLDDLSRKIDQVNRKPINPVSPQTARQLDALNQKFQQLLKVDGELRRRINATGQKGALFEDIDWSATHPDKVARGRKQASVREYLGLEPSSRPNAPPPPNHPPPPRNGGGGNAATGMVVGAAQAGLRAAGSAGGVAANALGTGVQAASGGGGLMAGAGAGLMGLMGGLLALGVGKIVGSVMENLHKAEDNNVGYDKLKRTLGDVNVSFEALKRVVSSSADNLHLTYGEMGEYSQRFAQSANMKASQYTSIGDEVGLGLGLSRGFGLDPSLGVGLMGQMRGMGITTDTQESRRFALLIGETIGKSNAFAKADEVMQAISGFAESQTRNSMSTANAEGYAGMFSSMVGSGIPGMDVAGSASLLNRINSSLSAGGAKGEASQFFTALVGNRMGLDPLQTQVMREGGAFATNDKMFGSGSAYAAYMGHTGPTGGSTFLQNTRDMLEQQYGGNSDDQKLLRAQAFANHTGVNMNQSMAMLSLKPNQMGEMEKYAGDITKLNGSGIASLAKVVTGTDEDRKGVAESLLRRDDLTSKEKDRVENAMKNGSTEEQKQVLATLVASREQERTTGSDIRDSKNALDNIKTSIADKLVPLTLEMRHGIMAIAGGGKKSSQEVMKEVIELESADRLKSALGRSKTEQNELVDRKIEINRRQESLQRDMLNRSYKDKPEILAKKMQERADLEAELIQINERLKQVADEQVKITEKENARKKIELESLNESSSARWAMEEATSKGRQITPSNPQKRDEAMKYFMSEEGGGWSKEQASSIVANLIGESQLDPKAFNPEGGGKGARGQAQWRGPRIDKFRELYGKDILEASDKEQWAYANYELTKGAMTNVGNKLRKTTDAKAGGELISREYEIHKNANEDARRGVLAEKLAKGGTAVPKEAAGTPLPQGAGPGRGQDPSKLNVSAEPIVVRHEDAKGNEIKFPQFVNLKFVVPGEPLVKK